MLTNWTYGVEHELADWDRRKGVPLDCDLDERDVTMVNSNGIAVDPRGVLYPYGGELRTRPTDTPAGQVEVLQEMLQLHPDATVNYRSNLHVHIRIPGLSTKLFWLKHLAAFNNQWLSTVLPLVEPIPEPTRGEFPQEEEYQGARRRWRRRRRSHHTVLPQRLFLRQLTAQTPRDFHDLGVPWSRAGAPLPYCQPRCAVNLRQLLETDTIEFRHFPGTLSEEELLVAIMWCRDYLRCAFTNVDPVQLFHQEYQTQHFPTFPPYCHWMEERYRNTCHDGSRTKAEIRAAIAQYLTEGIPL